MSHGRSCHDGESRKIAGEREKSRLGLDPRSPTAIAIAAGHWSKNSRPGIPVGGHSVGELVRQTLSQAVYATQNGSPEALVRTAGLLSAGTEDRPRFLLHAAKRPWRPGPDQASVGKGRVIKRTNVRLAERNPCCPHSVDVPLERGIELETRSADSR